jgi:hypothetical protein
MSKRKNLEFYKRRKRKYHQASNLRKKPYPSLIETASDFIVPILKMSPKEKKIPS